MIVESVKNPELCIPTQEGKSSESSAADPQVLHGHPAEYVPVNVCVHGLHVKQGVAEEEHAPRVGAPFLCINQRLKI